MAIKKSDVIKFGNPQTFIIFCISDKDFFEATEGAYLKMLEQDEELAPTDTHLTERKIKGGKTEFLVSLMVSIP